MFSSTVLGEASECSSADVPEHRLGGLRTSPGGQFSCGSASLRGTGLLGEEVAVGLVWLASTWSLLFESLVQHATKHQKHFQ